MAGRFVLFLIEEIVELTAPQASCPSTINSGVFSTSTAYSKLARLSRSEIPGDANDKQVAARTVEGEFGSDARVGAAQYASVRILSVDKSRALGDEIMPLRDALDIALVASCKRSSACSGVRTFWVSAGFVFALRARVRRNASMAPRPAPNESISRLGILFPCIKAGKPQLSHMISIPCLHHECASSWSAPGVASQIPFGLRTFPLSADP